MAIVAYFDDKRAMTVISGDGDGGLVDPVESMLQTVCREFIDDEPERDRHVAGQLHVRQVAGEPSGLFAMNIKKASQELLHIGASGSRSSASAA